MKNVDVEGRASRRESLHVDTDSIYYCLMYYLKVFRVRNN